MKKIFILISICFSLLGNDVYIKANINDSDGWTNVRENKNVKSKIIAQIYENEIFYTLPSEQNWWKIRYKDITGFMHKSRIKLFGKYYKASMDILNNDYLKELSKNDLAIMRNEIFARYGYKFEKEIFREYFESEPWYEGKFDSINFNLSNIETQNIKNIKRYENLKNKNESMTKQRAINLVYSDGINLNKLPEKYKKDKDIVLTAVKQDGLALYYADESLKKDKDVVLAAVKQRALALKYADKSLKKDKDIVLTAVKQDGLSLYWADKSLKEDLDVLKALGK